MNEVFAIKELAPGIASTGLVVPIFQLIAIDTDFINRAKGIAKLGQRFCLLVNAYQAVSIGSAEALIERIDADYPGIVLPGIEIKADTPAVEVVNFTAKYSARRCVIVHRDGWIGGNIHAHLAGFSVAPVHIYMASALPGAPAPILSAGKVILTDGFVRQLTNGAYPARSYFNNYATSYSGAGYNGFGDFGPVGDFYRVGGGQASHVALHLTQFIQEGLVCNHFVSSGTPITSHIHVKYDDALKQLRAYALPSISGFSTRGVADYHQPHSYPGLGMPKRWSIKHHTELMVDFLVAQKVVPFI
ncbi:hypothetical protein SAMN05421681_10122 [Lysobacter enzymogenes]|nr:hypothetical protein SAMN05421681_10122 [Lysobacter enzymogenes]